MQCVTVVTTGKKKKKAHSLQETTSLIEDKDHFSETVLNCGSKHQSIWNCTILTCWQVQLILHMHTEHPRLHAWKHTHTCTHAHTLVHTHTYTHMLEHTHTHTHARTRLNTYTTSVSLNLCNSKEYSSIKSTIECLSSMTREFPTHPVLRQNSSKWW